MFRGFCERWVLPLTPIVRWVMLWGGGWALNPTDDKADKQKP